MKSDQHFVVQSDKHFVVQSDQQVFDLPPKAAGLYSAYFEAAMSAFLRMKKLPFLTFFVLGHFVIGHLDISALLDVLRANNGLCYMSLSVHRTFHDETFF